MGPGSVLAERYEVVRRIARGGTSDVLEARGNDGHRYAIKLLREELSDDEEAIARFHREARAAAALKSPHTVRVLDFGISERNMPFIVMELLQGNDLEHEIRMRGALPIDEAATYLAQACKSMMEAHEAGIIHRDLKPPNLFLAEEGHERRLKVLDFGISKLTLAQHEPKLTLTEARFGSPLYMSPEAFRSTKSADARSDIWSLGVIFYEIITGMPPFMAENAVAVGVEVCKSEPILPSQRRPGLPRTADVVTARALKKDPSERYQSMAELLAALEVLLPRPSGTMTLMRIDRPGDVDTDDARTIRRDVALADLVMLTAAPAAAPGVLPPPPAEGPITDESSDGPTLVAPVANIRARVKERKKKAADHLWGGPKSAPPPPAPAPPPPEPLAPEIENPDTELDSDVAPTPVSNPPPTPLASEAPPAPSSAPPSSGTAGALSESDLPEIPPFIHALPTAAIHDGSRASVPSSLPRDGDPLILPARSPLRRALWLAPLAALVLVAGGWLFGRATPESPAAESAPARDASATSAAEPASATVVAVTPPQPAATSAIEPVPTGPTGEPSGEPSSDASREPSRQSASAPESASAAPSVAPLTHKPKPSKPPSKPQKPTRYAPTGL